MWNDRETVALVYNGELYNFRELRGQLRAKGHTFRTESDTEVILMAWIEWGPQCVERFRGMFAFSLVDMERRKVFMARDHFGIKPLYYSLDNSRLLFASEIQGLGHTFDREVNLEAIDQFLMYRFIPAPNTVFKQVSKLEPATRLTVDFDGSTTGPESYWSVTFQADSDDDVGAWTERFTESLKESVEAHLVSDVPFGAFLSGGVDSTAVVGLMSEVLDRPVETFTIVFDESEYDEGDYARTAAEQWGTHHHEQSVRQDALSILPELIRHHGEPFGDSSSIPTWHLCRFAREHVPMVLSGDGGDEALCGYGRYTRYLNRISEPAGAAKSRLGRWFGDRSPYPHRTYTRWRTSIQELPRDRLGRLWRPEYRERTEAAHRVFEAGFERSMPYHPLTQAQYMDYQGFLPDDILPKVDIAAMTHGLEVRTPLVDRNV
ncbi:MAG: asparagine synthase (glutamine-hydrolyzing), partial [Verrucomicrobiota bacterium]